MQTESCRVYSVESDVGYWSFFLFLKSNWRQIFGNIWLTAAGKMDVVEYVLWSRMWAIQQYARPSIHQELSGMLPSIHKSCNTYTLNINTRLIFISMFYYFSFPSNSMSMCSIYVRCLESLCRILHFVDLHSAIWRGLPKSKNKFRSFVILFYEVPFWILHIIFKCRN